MMKFPKPRTLLENQYPDNVLPLPELLKSIVNTVRPEPNTPMYSYLDSTIKHLKDLQKKKGQTIELNSCIIGSNLFFLQMIVNDLQLNIPTLVDTGATNSLIHSSLASKLKLKVHPISMKLSTATGVSSTAIKGLTHAKMSFKLDTGKLAHFNTIFIVSDQLNGLQAILGAEFLLDESRVKHISGSAITAYSTQSTVKIPIISGSTLSQNQITVCQLMDSTILNQSSQTDLDPPPFPPHASLTL
jgi:actin-related protein